MAQRVYASTADYAEFAEEQFEGDDIKLGKRLRAASIEVEKITRLSVYATDEDGYPTDAGTSEAFSEATCAIVEHWEDTGDPRGTDATQGAVKILSVSLGTTSSSTDNLTSREKLARHIGERAIDILTNAGLLSSAVSHT